MGATPDDTKDEFRAVILVLCPPKQLETLQRMLRGSGRAYSVLALTLGRFAGAGRIPGLVEDKLQFRDAVSQ